MVTMYKCAHVDSQSVCHEIILHLYASTPDGTCTMCPSSADQTRVIYDDDALGDKCECNNAMMMSIAIMSINVYSDDAYNDGKGVYCWYPYERTKGTCLSIISWW